MLVQLMLFNRDRAVMLGTFNARVSRLIIYMRWKSIEPHFEFCIYRRKDFESKKKRAINPPSRPFIYSSFLLKKGHMFKYRL